MKKWKEEEEEVVDDQIIWRWWCQNVRRKWMWTEHIVRLFRREGNNIDLGLGTINSNKTTRCTPSLSKGFTQFRPGYCSPWTNTNYWWPRRRSHSRMDARQCAVSSSWSPDYRHWSRRSSSFHSHRPVGTMQTLGSIFNMQKHEQQTLTLRGLRSICGLAISRVASNMMSFLFLRLNILKKLLYDPVMMWLQRGKGMVKIG